MKTSGAAGVARDTSLWPSKSFAARDLGVSERTLERAIRAGKLLSAMRHASGRKPEVVVDPEGLEELRTPPARGVVVSPDRTALASGRIVSAGPDIDVGAIARQLLGALGPARPTVRPWLTLDEAAEYSGLPRAWLLSQARGGSPIALDVGVGSRTSWRFSRELLDRAERGGLRGSEASRGMKWGGGAQRSAGRTGERGLSRRAGAKPGASAAGRKVARAKRASKLKD